MSTNYPGALDVLQNPQAIDQQNTAGVEHDQEHANVNDAVEALEAKVGITSSSDQAAHDWLIKRGVAPQAALGTTTGTITVSMNQVAYASVTLTGDATFATSNRPSDSNTAKTVNIIIKAGAASRQISFAAGVVLLNNTAPMTLASGKTAMVTLTSTGPNETDTIASYAAQP